MTPRISKTEIFNHVKAAKIIDITELITWLMKKGSYTQRGAPTARIKLLIKKGVLVNVNGMIKVHPKLL